MRSRRKGLEYRGRLSQCLLLGVAACYSVAVTVEVWNVAVEWGGGGVLDGQGADQRQNKVSLVKRPQAQGHQCSVRTGAKGCTIPVHRPQRPLGL